MPYVDGLKLTAKQSKMRDSLLKEERTLRGKQPVGWAKSKYRHTGIYQTVLSKVLTELGYDKKNLTPEQRIEIGKEVSRIFGTINKDAIYSNSQEIIRV
jgi:hypothetical protein